MKDLLERLTLYDLFGYAFPGSIVILTAVFCYGNIDLWEKHKDLLPYITLAAGILSYFIGMLLSEVAARIHMIFKEWILKKEFEEWNCEKTSIASAIEKHKGDGAFLIINDEKGWEKCMKYMYSAVQISQETKRIHNYASTEVMCRNLCYACLFSGIMLAACFGWHIMLIAVIWALLMGGRAFRFGRKKREYTIYWFLQQ